MVAHPSSLAPSPSLVCVLGVFNGDQLKRDFFLIILLHLLAVKTSSVSLCFPLAKC